MKLPKDITVGTAPAETNHALLIKVKNAAELVRSQGALAAFAQTLAPATLESKVLSTLRDKLTSALKEQNVDADISIVEPKAFTAAGGGHIARDVGLVVAGVGGLALLYHLFRGRWFGKKRK